MRHLAKTIGIVGISLMTTAVYAAPPDTSPNQALQLNLTDGTTQIATVDKDLNLSIRNGNIVIDQPSTDITLEITQIRSMQYIPCPSGTQTIGEDLPVISFDNGAISILPNGQNTLTVKILTTDGREVRRIQSHGETVITLDDFLPGIYILNYGQGHSLKFIIR